MRSSSTSDLRARTRVRDLHARSRISRSSAQPGCSKRAPEYRRMQGEHCERVTDHELQRLSAGHAAEKSRSRISQSLLKRADRRGTKEWSRTVPMNLPSISIAQADSCSEKIGEPRVSFLRRRCFCLRKRHAEIRGRPPANARAPARLPDLATAAAAKSGRFPASVGTVIRTS